MTTWTTVLNLNRVYCQWCGITVKQCKVILTMSGHLWADHWWTYKFKNNVCAITQPDWASHQDLRSGAPMPAISRTPSWEKADGPSHMFIQDLAHSNQLVLIALSISTFSAAGMVSLITYSLQHQYIGFLTQGPVSSKPHNGFHWLQSHDL